jgi:hypothetical protein
VSAGHVYQADLFGDVCHMAIHVLAEDLRRMRVDGNDSPTALPHVAGDGVGGFGRWGARFNNCDRGVPGQDLFDDVIGAGHGLPR